MLKDSQTTSIRYYNIDNYIFTIKSRFFPVFLDFEKSSFDQIDGLKGFGDVRMLCVAIDLMWFYLNGKTEDEDLSKLKEDAIRYDNKQGSDPPNNFNYPKGILLKNGIFKGLRCYSGSEPNNKKLCI